ncbi:DNA mismatch repair protein MutH, partial [Staphylococcus epidermidis]
ILRKYILGNEEIDSIVKSPFELKNKSIEDIVLEKFKPYYNQTIDSIGEKFNVDRGGKNYHNRIASAILNLKGKIKGNETFPK